MPERADFNASTEGAGVMVEAPDGRVFFLPEADAAKFQVTTDSSNLHRALLHAGRRPQLQQQAGQGQPPPQQPQESCEYMLNWLLTHDPHSRIWRQNSVTWINNC